MKKFFRFLAPLLFACAIASAQSDINVPPTSNQYTVLGRGFNWGGSGSGNLNNNFIFNPIDANQGFCLFISNNNPSSSHTVSVGVFQTGDPALTKFTGFAQKWFGVPTTTTFPVTVPAAGIVGINYKTTASAGITIQFSGATTQAGSPDTVDFFAVQTTASACGSIATNVVQGPVLQGNTETASNQFPVQVGGVQIPGSTSTVTPFNVGPQGGLDLDGTSCCADVLGNNFFVASSSANMVRNRNISGIDQISIQAVCPLASFGNVTTVRVLCGYTRNSLREEGTDMSSITGGNMPVFAITGRVVNPGATSMIVLDTLSTAATIDTQVDTMTFACSAACELQVLKVTSNGTGCTALTAQPMNLWGSTQPAYGTGHAAFSGTGCTVQPTSVGIPLWDVFIPANGTQTLDVRGLTNVRQSTALAGWAVFNVTAVTGTVVASATLVED